jgi:hypothetical protein
MPGTKSRLKGGKTARYIVSGSFRASQVPPPACCCGGGWGAIALGLRHEKATSTKNARRLSGLRTTPLYRPCHLAKMRETGVSKAAMSQIEGGWGARPDGARCRDQVQKVMAGRHKWMTGIVLGPALVIQLG